MDLSVIGQYNCELTVTSCSHQVVLFCRYFAGEKTFPSPYSFIQKFSKDEDGCGFILLRFKVASVQSVFTYVTGGQCQRHMLHYCLTVLIARIWPRINSLKFLYSGKLHHRRHLVYSVGQLAICFMQQRAKCFCFVRQFKSSQSFNLTGGHIWPLVTLLFCTHSR